MQAHHAHQRDCLAARARRLARAAMHGAQRGALIGLLPLALGACGSIGVKPWERDLMAKPEMLLDAAPVDASIDDHVYFSKEASTGGRGFGGGGCGCN